MTLASAILWAAASLLAAGIMATGARSLGGFSRAELEDQCRRRRADHLASEIVLKHRAVALAAESFEVLASAVFLATLGSIIFHWLAPETAGLWWRCAVVAFGGGLALVVVNAWIASAVARVWAAPFLAVTWPLWRSVGRLATPLSAMAEWVDAAAHRLTGRTPAEFAEPTFEGEIRTIVSEGQREGLLEEEAREMIEGVIQLGDAEVSQIMTPRTYMLSMHIGLPLADVVKFAISSGHTRIPVYDKNRDDVVGILHMKDLLPELMKPPGDRVANAANLLRPAHFVPETKRLDALLEEFQRTGNHMAVVLDEFGGVSGLVTIEDVLEEIVGEIVDEYDDALVEGIKSIDDHTAEALARVRIDEVNERLGIHLSEGGEFDTIGGFVFSHLGHIPGVGEEVIVDDVKLTVMDVTRRRIERVRIEVLDPAKREMA
ncbi:MAG: HlyC/CorC family transporter [Planctomycetia bacterium]|nr:HlyC/CorC family transporter [Planctomycetia bacterium]